MRSPEYQALKHSGVITDLPPEEVGEGAWTGGSNIQFQDSSTRRVEGHASFAGTLLGEAIFAVSVRINEVTYWVYCSTTKIYLLNAGVHSDISPTTPIIPCKPGDWSATVLNGVLVLNNAQGPPLYWEGSGVCKPLPGWPPAATCGAIRAFKYHLFALRITDGTQQDHSLWWSAAAPPGTIPQEWVPSSTNDAGDLALADTGGVIVDALPLRDLLIVYKTGSAYALAYSAGSQGYVQRKLFLTIGAAALNCIVEYGGYHYLLTPDDLLKHDSQSSVSMLQGKARHNFMQSLDQLNTQLCCMALAAKTRLLYAAIPIAGRSGISQAYLINLLTGELATQQLTDITYITAGLLPGAPSATETWENNVKTWETDTTTWASSITDIPDPDSLVLVDPAKLMAVTASSYTFDGQPIASYAERLSVPVGDPIARALVTRVVPRVEGPTGTQIQIRVGGQPFFGSPISWSGPLLFEIGKNVSVECQVEGRLISTRFESVAGGQWILHSYRMGVVDLGLY